MNTIEKIAEFWHQVVMIEIENAYYETNFKCTILVELEIPKFINWFLNYYASNEIK